MLDQNTDRSFRTLVAKLSDFGPDAREFVKTAAVDYDELAALPDQAFAWEEKRMFPIHSPEHAGLSLIYAAGEDLPERVCARLEKAASLYEIEFEPLEKVAAEEVEDPATYLIPQKRFGKVDSAETVKEGEDFYYRNYKKMDLETRTHAAVTLVKQASYHEVSISTTLRQQAGLTEVDRVKLAEWLEVRRNLSESPAVKEGFNKLASFVEDKKQFSHASRKDLIKLAETIGTLDLKEGLEKRYDHTLPDPMMTVFNTQKTAGEETITLAGKNVPVSKLSRLDPESYGDVLGADLVPEITEKDGSLDTQALVTILKTLPADLQVILVKNLGI